MLDIDIKNKDIDKYTREIRKLKFKNINYEKAITLGMLFCAGNGDGGELSPNASLKDKKGIEQVIENRMAVTNRTFYQEATAEYQFSAFNKRGLYIDKYNIPRQAKCLKNAINLISEPDLEEFNYSTFYHSYKIEPKWKDSFIEVARTKIHIFYIGDKGYKNAKIISKFKKGKTKVKKSQKINKTPEVPETPIIKKIKIINEIINKK
jgi:hypothetical protein